VILVLDLYMRHGRAMRAANDADKRAEATERRLTEAERRIAELELKLNAPPPRNA